MMVALFTLLLTEAPWLFLVGVSALSATGVLIPDGSTCGGDTQGTSGGNTAAPSQADPVPESAWHRSGSSPCTKPACPNPYPELTQKRRKGAHDQPHRRRDR